VAYAGGWKRLEPLWDLVIRARRVNTMLPLLEATLDAFGGIGRSSRAAPQSIGAGRQPGPTSASSPKPPATSSPRLP
jgi:hypothetical protein